MQKNSTLIDSSTEATFVDFVLFLQFKLTWVHCIPQTHAQFIINTLWANKYPATNETLVDNYIPRPYAHRLHYHSNDHILNGFTGLQRKKRIEELESHSSRMNINSAHPSCRTRSSSPATSSSACVPLYGTTENNSFEYKRQPQWVFRKN